MLNVKIYEKEYECENGVEKRKLAYLYLDLGYTKKILSWDISLCAEVLQISVYSLYQKECGVYKVC